MKDKKSFQINPFVLIFAVIAICGLLTFVITPGTLVDGVYTALPKNVFNFNNVFNIFRAIPYGIKDSANIVILILIVGGALEIYKRTGAIDNSISSLVRSFGEKSRLLLLITLIVVFSAIGGWLGWIEVIIPFVPLVIAVVLALGYDALTAAAVCIVGTMAGFIAGPTNLYTVGIANGILQKMGLMAADESVFTGMEFRAVLWVVITLISVVYITVYATRTYKSPEKSLVSGIDVSDIKLDLSKTENSKLTVSQIFVLLTILGAMIMTVIGMQYGFDGVKWGIDDVSAIFFASGILAGIIGKLKSSDLADAFIAGAKGSVGGAMVVGVARGVFWVLEKGQINATVIHSATELLKGTSPLVAAIGIVIIVSFINGLIPSGSGKAALLTPIIVPISIALGLTQQTAVLAYQFGDGITNMFWFSYGTLLIFLSYAKVPLNKWYKFFVPLMFIFFGVAVVTLGIAISIGF
ncbi:MAG: AbgT family transporter [Oscillospiraceae bacterium]